MLCKDVGRCRSLRLFLRGFVILSMAVMVWGLGATHVQASCYKEALEGCLQAFQQRKTACKASYDTASPLCRPQRVKAISTCSTAKREWECTRQKKMSETEQARCSRRVEAVRERCKNSGGELGACRSAFTQCQRQCIKGCTTCTMRSISRCVGRCKSSQRVCSRASQDLGRICKRKAARERRICQRQFTLRAWDRYYLCLSRRLRADLRCQYKAYDQERDCVHKASDGFRDCSRENSEAYQVCKADAKAKCGR
ncbi:MAG: hypothetical protein H6728_13415 [Myxococcales bacterium]|nr:hypothetical protein [Myxococcales bacterium]MCB9644068.1 hypothetical protein [Myxococcales bacterium]